MPTLPPPTPNDLLARRVVDQRDATDPALDEDPYADRDEDDHAADGDTHWGPAFDDADAWDDDDGEWPEDDGLPPRLD